MKASFDQNFKTKFTASHRKENKFDKGYKGVICKDNQIHVVVDLRLYQTDSRTYCCVWIQKPSLCTSGSGYAGGYGYHLESAAAENALINAGISLTESISGVGDTAIKNAIKAICELLFEGCPNEVISCYG